jgi:hypothetical protein
MTDVITTTGRMRRLVERLAEQLLRAGPSAGATREDGIRGLHEQLLDSLDVGEFGDPDQRDVLEDARKFCTSHCSEAEEDGPGRALRCVRCPLKYHALTRYEETVEQLASEAAATRKENA